MASNQSKVVTELIFFGSLSAYCLPCSNPVLSEPSRAEQFVEGLPIHNSPSVRWQIYFSFLPLFCLNIFLNELSKRDFLLSYLLWYRVLIFTHNSFLAYNCGISFGRQNIMPNSNQTEFLQKGSFRKVCGKEGKKTMSWL